MKIKNINKKLVTLAVLLMLSMVASVMLVPTANAHDPAWQIPTYAYVQAVPNPVGVNQQAIIYMWIDKIPDGAALDNDIRFQDYQITITAPDGTTQTQTFATVQDPTSNQHFFFTPTQIGTYKLDFSFPGYTYNYTGPIAVFGPPAPSLYIGDTYLASSASATLTVQQEQIATIPSNPLPSNYWTRPIYGENPNWWSISSNWLGYDAPGYVTGFPGDAVGPQTSHIMWTKPYSSGGVVGGNDFVIQGDTFFEGSAYVQRFEKPIILDGKLFYTESLSFGGVPGAFTPQPYGPTVCVDLRTGEVLWSRTDVPWPSFGYMYAVHEPNQHGVYEPILISQTGGVSAFGATPALWQAFDAYTGDPLFNVTNVPVGKSAMGPEGEYLIYVLSNVGTPTSPQYYLAQWNSSRLWDGQYEGLSTTPTVVPPITDGNDPSLYDWNISIPSLNSMSVPSSIVDVVKGDLVLGMSGFYPSGPVALGATSWTPYTYFALNLDKSKGAIGSVLWTNDLQPPAGNITVSYIGADPTANNGAGVFCETHKETMQRVGYSLTTGQKIWGPVGDQVAFQYYSTLGYYSGGVGGCVLAYGKLYSAGYGGIIYCYDTANGNLLWTYGNGGEGNTTTMGYGVRGNYPTSIYAIGNGVVYTITTEHTVQTPIYKGALTRAINATDGTEIYTLSAYTSAFNIPTACIADGYATFYNGYDNQVYSIGRGPSETSVTVSPKVSGSGGQVLIEGSVIDTAAGTKQSEQLANFPSGVPAVSDASMKDWMGFVYQQLACPTTVTGVPVHLTAIDPNGNYQDIGYATSNGLGNYATSWTPPVPGVYTVTATFEGTNGYFGSQAGTAFLVSAASPAGVIVSPSPVVTSSPSQSSSSSQTSSPVPSQTVAPTSAPTQTSVSPLPSVAPQPASGIPATTYIAIAAAVVIIAVIAAALVFRRRK
jgi:hypothetical protein